MSKVNTNVYCFLFSLKGEISLSSFNNNNLFHSPPPKKRSCCLFDTASQATCNLPVRLQCILVLHKNFLLLQEERDSFIGQVFGLVSVLRSQFKEDKITVRLDIGSWLIFSICYRLCNNIMINLHSVIPVYLYLCPIFYWSQLYWFFRF